MADKPRLYVCKQLPHCRGGYEVRTQDETVPLWGPLGRVESDKRLSVWLSREEAEADMTRRLNAAD